MRRRQTYIYIALAVLIIGGSAAQFGGVYFHWYRAPYNTVGKTISWIIGIPETAYNFDVVVPGRLYRSGLPDARFLDYVRRRYGIQHVVSLSGASKIDTRAKDLGMNVTVLHWRTNKPPAEDLKMLLTLFDGSERILVHCRAGRDRSGYAIAIYRMLRQHWPLEQAIQEMEAHGHSPRHHSETNQVLSESLREVTDQPVGVSQSEFDSRTSKHSTTSFMLTLKPGISKGAS